MSFQLPLGLGLRDDATFLNFFSGASNHAVLAALTAPADQSEPFIYLFGRSGVGCSHLLQAACHQAGVRHKRAVYLPLRELLAETPKLLDGMDSLDLVCIDDIEHVAGQKRWEEALFHLFNQLRESGRQLLVAGHVAPAQLPVRLPDLKSRLSWGLALQLQPLSDDEKVEALRMRARHRGLDFSEEVGRYILGRSPRMTHQLFDALNRLDGASLRAKRKLTVPFVKQVMGW